MLETNIDPQTIKVGDRVVVSKRYGGKGPTTPSLNPGTEVTVAKVKPRSPISPGVLLGIEGVDNGHPHFGYEWFDLVEVAPTRPTIDLSDRPTAMAAAKTAWSRVLKPESQAVLADAGNGIAVDAYALNEAVLDAMRSSATRCAQSVARRKLATTIAHLGHITQAVLENHADGLPAYAKGDRSRAVETLKADLQQARNDLRLVGEKAEEARREQDSTILTLQQRVAEANRRGSEAGDHLALALGEAEVLRSTLNYALSLLPVVERARVEGYRDAKTGQ